MVPLCSQRQLQNDSDEKKIKEISADKQWSLSEKIGICFFFLLMHTVDTSCPGCTDCTVSSSYVPKVQING
ncbi:hypothetical protein BDE02_14G053400 [Populus trichocarpa]|nr:hypothetical protein BDE02_14G053400 [Populus trichocarpa]